MLANLIASLLVMLADELAAALTGPGGRMLASGIFIDREPDVRVAFEAAGLRIVERTGEGDWVALDVERPVGERHGRMIPSAWFPYILVAHITFAISLFLPSFLLPFTMRTRTRDGEPVQATPGSVRVAAAVAGAERHHGHRPGRAHHGADAHRHPGFHVRAAAVAAGWHRDLRGRAHRLVLHPAPRACAGCCGISKEATPEEQQKWRDRAKRQRYVSYGMAAAVGVIGWLMMAKPGA